MENKYKIEIRNINLRYTFLDFDQLGASFVTGGQSG